MYAYKDTVQLKGGAWSDGTWGIFCFSSRQLYALLFCQCCKGKAVVGESETPTSHFQPPLAPQSRVEQLHKRRLVGLHKSWRVHSHPETVGYTSRARPIRASLSLQIARAIHPGVHSAAHRPRPASHGTQRGAYKTDPEPSKPSFLYHTLSRLHIAVLSLSHSNHLVLSTSSSTLRSVSHLNHLPSPTTPHLTHRYHSIITIVATKTAASRVLICPTIWQISYQTNSSIYSHY